MAAYAELIVSMISFYLCGATFLNKFFGRVFWPVGKPLGIWKKAPAGSALLLAIDNNNYLQSASIVRDDNISWELHNIYRAHYLHGFLSPIACEKAKTILSRYYMIHGMEGNYEKRIPTKTVC